MWLPRAPLPTDLPDIAEVVATLAAHADLFDRCAPLVLARAPGRLDLMGGIADYCGALVLELPLACATLVAAQLVDAPDILVRSLDGSATGSVADVQIDLADLAPGGMVLDETAAHRLLTADPARAWAAYVLGPLVTLARAYDLRLLRGLRLLITSSVPTGKGVSSSAAIEVASMQALAALLGVDLSGRELALLCQRAENLVVGAPCGVMDQMTAACGTAGELLALRCQPAELEPGVALPAGLEVWGIDSGIRHAVSGADYGVVRVGAFMGYRILADLVGLSVQACGPGRVAIADPRWGGYLANLAPSEWEQHYAARLPVSLSGAAFLAQYGGTNDTVTQVEAAQTYAVRAPTAHPVYEHQRVRLFRAMLLAGAASEEERWLLGELMYQSHASYSACGLGSDGTDRLVALAREAGPREGIYGAKITGGGSGGTVAMLARRDSEPSVRELARAYVAETGRPAMVLGGSSPGAVALGARWLGPIGTFD